MNEAVSWRQKVRYWMRHCLGVVHIKKSSMKRPIVIFSSRRGGSTLLAQVIGSERGVNVSDQPFDLWHYNPYANRMPNPYLSTFIDLAPEDEKKLCGYCNDLFSGKIRVYTRWNLFDPDYSFVINRMVFKVLSAKALIDWFAENFELDIVYQIRHPIAYALSIMRLNWGCTADAFLQSPFFRERFLDERKLSMCHRILKGDNELQKYVLEWGLDNLIPLSVFQNRPWTTLTYEELVARPQQSCELLAARLKLSDPIRMAKRLSHPSVSTTHSSRSDISELTPVSLLARWMDRVDSSLAQDAMAMLDELLGIHVYTWDNPFPDVSVCNFGVLIE